MCRIVNMHNEKFDVDISRPSKWGNPFTVSQYGRKEAINRYKEWIMTKPDLMKALHELKGKTLGCHCKPKACHGDI